MDDGTRRGSNHGNTQIEKTLYHQSFIDFRRYLELAYFEPRLPSRKIWHALHAVDAYLSSQSTWLVNYAERHRAGLRVGTSITEGTANFLITGAWPSRSRCDGLDAVPTCCCRSG